MNQNKSHTDGSTDCILYLVRHGESQANLERRLAGQFDSPLTPKGMQQAQEVARSLKNVHFDFAFSSDLIRAKETTEIIAAKHNLTVQTNHLLRERQFGHFQNKTYEQVKSEYDKAFDNISHVSKLERFKFKPFEDVESDHELVSRYITILRQIAIGHPGKTGLIGTHGGVMRHFLIHLDWATAEALSIGSIDNTAYVKIASDGIDFTVLETMGINLNHSLKN